MLVYGKQIQIYDCYQPYYRHSTCHIIFMILNCIPIINLHNTLHSLKEIDICDGSC